jgi:hypothetical protein
MTLQIPSLYIQIPGFPINCRSEADLEEIPENWICCLTYNDVPAAGNVSAFTYFSSVGWEANKEEIKKLYLSCPVGVGGRGNWAAFEDYAQKHFATVAKKLQISLLKTEAELAAAQLGGNTRSIAYWQRKVNHLKNFTV